MILKRPLPKTISLLAVTGAETPVAGGSVSFGRDCLATATGRFLGPAVYNLHKEATPTPQLNAIWLMVR